MGGLRSTTLLGGFAALFALIGVTLFAFRGLAGFDDARFDMQLLTDRYTLRILRFSLWQALLSTLISLALAWPLARWLYRLQPKALGVFQQLCLLAFVMPTLVVITSVMLLLGPQGSLRSLLPEDWKLFGLSGILIAHVYLNFPLATRILLQRYQAMPDGVERLSAQLKLAPFERFTLLEWPQIKPVLLALAGLIFILCFNSFAVVLALGGGPASTTFELAIYQALKYQFNLSEALTLAWMQFIIAGALFALAALFAKVDWLGTPRISYRWQPRTTLGVRLLQRSAYVFGWLLLLAPIIALASSLELTKLFDMNMLELAQALGRSVVIALGATLVALLLCLLVMPLQHNALLGWLSTHHLVAPAMVLSTGIYIWLLSFGGLRQWSTFWLVLLNALLVLPFLITQLRPTSINYQQQYHRLVANLNLNILERTIIYLSYLKPAVISAFALGLLLALGDVSVFALFGSYDEPTLPWLIYRYAGSYRLEEAAIAASLLLLVSISLLLLLERYRRTQTR